jgi:hypothetical protein
MMVTVHYDQTLDGHTDHRTLKGELVSETAAGTLIWMETWGHVLISADEVSSVYHHRADRSLVKP